MGVLEVILIIFFLSLIGRKNVKSDYGTTTAADEEKVEEAEVGDGESLSIVKERIKNAQLINECISQMNSSKNRPSIVSWRFKENSADEIYFHFANEKYEREGKVYYIYDKALPRVSQIQFWENENKKVLKGYIVKNFTLDQLYRNFAKEKQDKERLTYLNNVSMKALIEGGKSEFNVLEYQRITEKEFTQVFGKKEIKSLIKLLKEEFKDVDQTSVPWILSVTAFEEPIEAEQE